MSWLDLRDLQQENSEDSPKTAPITSLPASKVSPLEEAFIQEITELFDVPREQIPSTSETQQFQLDLPTSDLHEQAVTSHENTSFLDLLMN